AAGLFATPLNALLTILVAWLLLMVLPAATEWLFLDADFHAATAAECRESSGACWSFIAHKHRLILFGIYPYEEQWRPMLASFILIALVVCTCMRRFWHAWLAVVWLVALACAGVLMWGGVLGLAPVE